MIYSDLHRFMLRTIASKGVLSMSETVKILHKYTGEKNTSIRDIVQDINNELRPIQQQIKITTDELTNEEVVIFLSLGYDDATKAQKLFSGNELEYFRVLLEHIMTTETRQITGIHAMNLAGNIKSTFTKTDAQKILNTWCRMQYLVKDDNNYALGVRAIHEFEGYFRQNMADTIEECFLCKQIVFRGCNCPVCAKAVHTRCLNKYLEKVQKWPCCKSDFSPDQLERLNNFERLSQSQLHQPQSIEEVTTAEVTQQLSEDMEISQNIIPEISQRVTKKRKRQDE